LLLVGSTGAGKSTAALHCLLEQFDLVSEDSVLVAPDSLRVTGLANFLHIRHDGLHFIDDAKVAARLRRAPVIRRRSGVRKLEIDLRTFGHRPGSRSPTIAGVVFLSPESVSERCAMAEVVTKRELEAQLKATQAYAATSPGWRTFVRSITSVPAFVVRRGRHPSDTTRVLRHLLTSARR
jgi:hypothetical protein